MSAPVLCKLPKKPKILILYWLRVALGAWETSSPLGY